MVLYPKVGFFGTTIEKTILVKNVNDVPVNVTLEASEDFKDMVKIIDKKFTLEPEEEKDARFTITIRKEGDYEGKISVLFAPEGGSGAGVALSSSIIIHAGDRASDTSEETDNTENSRNNNSSADNNANSSASKNKFPLAWVIFELIILVILVVIIIILVKKKKNRGSKAKESLVKEKLKTSKRSVRSL
jgi:hypothetical protein